MAVKAKVVLTISLPWDFFKGEARKPLVCGEGGHLFCKECVYASILNQRKAIDLDTQKVLAHNSLVISKEEQDRLREEERKREIFIALETKASGAMILGSSSGAGKDGKMDNPDPKKVAAFWLAENTPKAEEQKISIQKASPMCSAGSTPHPIGFVSFLIPSHWLKNLIQQTNQHRLKKLVPVIFKEEEGEEGKIVCPVCLKAFHLGLEICGMIMMAYFTK